MRTRIATLATVLTLGAGVGVATPAMAASGTSSPAPAATYGHPDLGGQKKTKKCKKMLRKMDRAERKGNYKKLNRLANRYNKKCRTER